MTVRSLARRKDGKWLLNLVSHPEGGWESRMTVTAGVVVLGAGTLGSTEILLRSRAEGLSLSERLGERFTTNGDALANAYNNDRPVNNIGVGYPAKVDTEPVGPAVAGLVDLRGTERLEDGLALVEAAIPSASAAILPALFAGGGPLFGRDSDVSLEDQLGEAGRALESLLNGAYRGAVRNTQTFLAVGHDLGLGRMRLERDRIAIDWPGAAQEPVFQRIEETFMRATAATGGTYMKNPLSLRLMGGNLMTVHPLGGCVMGGDRHAGVVNHKGQVFDGAPTPPTTTSTRGSTCATARWCRGRSACTRCSPSPRSPSGRCSTWRATGAGTWRRRCRRRLPMPRRRRRGPRDRSACLPRYVIPAKAGTQHALLVGQMIETCMGAGLSPRAPWRALAAPA